MREQAPGLPGLPTQACRPTEGAFQRAIDALPLQRSSGRRPSWAVELDLDLPCDAQSARRAFRRRALETHPDRPGGSHEAFLRSVQALDEALLLVR